MFFNKFACQQELENANAIIATLRSQLESEQRLTKSLREKAQEAVTGDMATSSFSVDYEEMNAFSVERLVKSGIPTTVVGYSTETVTWNSEGVATTTTDIKEWTMYCSQTQHEKLVADFNTYKTKKAKGAK